MSSMAGAGGGPLRETDLAKPSRQRRSGSPSEGSWISPPDPGTPALRRPAIIVCAVALAAFVALVVYLLVA